MDKVDVSDLKKVMRVDRVFCPRCGSRDLECLGAESPEWIGDMEIGAKEEYLCAECGLDFEIGSSYVLGCFSFLGQKDDHDILVEW